MSSITEAIKKRKKEIGQEKVEELIPVSLDEPNVEVPKARPSKQLVVLVMSLIVVGAVIGALAVLPGMLGGGSDAKKGSAGARIASLSKSEEGEMLPAGKPGEALPLPEESAQSVETPAKAGPGLTEAVVPPEMPVQKASPSATEKSLPVEEAVSPLDITATGSPPAGEVVVPETPPQRDPFAGVTLQGIIRFDPTQPEVLINGKTLKVGESFKDIQVVEIGAASVKLRCGVLEKVISY